MTNLNSDDSSSSLHLRAGESHRGNPPSSIFTPRSTLQLPSRSLLPTNMRLSLGLTIGSSTDMVTHPLFGDDDSGLVRLKIDFVNGEVYSGLY